MKPVRRAGGVSVGSWGERGARFEIEFGIIYVLGYHICAGVSYVMGTAVHVLPNRSLTPSNIELRILVEEVHTALRFKRCVGWTETRTRTRANTRRLVQA